MGSQFTEQEMIALRKLVERYFDIKEYGWHAWGRRFYERLYLVDSKLEQVIASNTGLGWFGLKDGLTYTELKILLNIVQSEGLRWAANEAGHSSESSENPTISLIIIITKLQERLKRYEV